MYILKHCAAYIRKPKWKFFIGQGRTEGRVNSSEGNKDQQRRTNRYKLLPISTNIYIVIILCGQLSSHHVCGRLSSHHVCRRLSSHVCRRLSSLPCVWTALIPSDVCGRLSSFQGHYIINDISSDAIDSKRQNKRQ